MCSIHPSTPDDSLPSKDNKQVLLSPSFKEELLLHQDVTSTATDSASFLSLPNELLILILEYLGEELYTLALLSRRLHYLALPIYLANNGMSPFSGELMLSNDFTAPGAVLRALSIALFKPSLKRISYTFNFYRAEQQVIKEMRMLMGLVSRIGTLEEAHLDIVHAGQGSPSEWNSLLKSFKPDWTEELKELLDLILEKHCQKLKLCHGGRRASSTADQIEMALNGRSQTLASRIFSSPKRLLFSSPPRMVRDLTLTTLSLHSPMLFHADFCRWTINMLNSSHITSLSLMYLNIYLDVWAVVLPHIALRFLQDLLLDSLTIPPTDLWDFLLRHPSIRKLTLGKSLLFSDILRFFPGRSPKSTMLPKLTHLSASPFYITYLLQSASNIFPRLKFVTIISRVRHGRFFDFEEVNDTLAGVAHRLLGRTKLGIRVSFESSTSDWMRITPPQPPTAQVPAGTQTQTQDGQGNPTDFQHQQQQQQFPTTIIATTTALSLPSTLPTPLPSVLPTPALASTPPTPPVPASSPTITDHISTLELQIGLYRLPQPVAHDIPRWIALFKGLNEVAFITLSAVGPTPIDQRRAFVKDVCLAAPGVRVIRINEVGKSVDEWLVDAL